MIIMCCLLIKRRQRKIVVLGELGDTENIGDHGSSKVHPYYTITPFRGLMKAMPCAEVLYNDGKDIEKARELAQAADAVVIVADISIVMRENICPTVLISRKARWAATESACVCTAEMWI